LKLLAEGQFLLAGFFVMVQLQTDQRIQHCSQLLEQRTVLAMGQQRSICPIFVDAFFAELTIWELELRDVTQMRQQELPVTPEVIRGMQ
jgi:hypothetical protein